MSGLQKGIKIGAVCFGIVLIVHIFSWCLTGLSWFANINFSGDEKKGITFEESYQGIDSILIDAVSSNILIESGTEFRVKAEKIEKNFSSKVRGNTLKIEESSNWFHPSNGGTITVIVPDGVVLRKLKIDTGAGKFKIKNIQANELDMDHGAGSLEIHHSIFEKSDIDGGAGEIKVVSTSFETLELDAGVGKVELEADIMSAGKIECGVGELELTLLGSKDDYRIQMEKGIGRIQIDGENQGNHTNYGTGTKRIELNGGVGSIEVNFKD